jgi:hypothetical protein
VVRPRSAASVALWALVGGLLSLYCVAFTWDALGRVARPLEELIYGESWVLDGARRVAHGEVLYPPADRLPLAQTAYTPVYYIVVGELQRLLGDAGYTTGRAVSLVASLVGAALLAWSLRRLSGHWPTGLLGAGLLLTQNVTVVLWAPLHRVDALALALTLAGLALATAGRPYAAVLPFLLAVFTKQTFVVAPVATCLALWPERGRMLRFGAAFLGGLGLLVGIAQWLTDGWFVWHTVLANSNVPDFETFAALMGSFLQFNGVVVLAAAAALSLPERPGERVWRLYFLGSLITLPSLAKIGASSNYWLELSVATAALLALGARRLALARAPQLHVLAPVVIAGALLVAVPAYQAVAFEAATTTRTMLQPQSPRYLSLVGDAGTQPYRVDASFLPRIAREHGDVLTDNPGLAVAAGKRIAYEFQIFQLLEAQGMWSEGPIVEAIAARQFDLVVLMHPLDGPVTGTRWTPAIRAALRQAYVPDGQQAGFWVYRPGPAQARAGP